MTRTSRFLFATALLSTACPGDTGSDPTGDSVATTDMTTINPTLVPTTEDDPSTGVPGPTTGETADTGDVSSGSTTTDACFAQDVVAEVTIPNVVLVLDKSGSMVSDPGGYWDADGDDADDDGFVDGDPNMTPATPKVTRWNSLYSVVDQIVTGFDDRMDFGAVLFPSKSATKDYSAAACPVNAEPEVPVGESQAQQILQTIPGAADTMFQGGTPAASGVETAVAALAGLDPERPQYLILITDGAANCAADAPDNNTRFEVYDERLAEVVAEANAGGILTFVVGIDIKNTTSPMIKDGNPDNTNTYEKLNMVAEAGGMPRPGDEKFYNTVNQVELQTALEGIVDVITSCVFPLSMPLKPNYHVQDITVDPQGDGLMYGEDPVTDCATESGWRYTDETRSAIELCGDACSLYKQTGEVDINFKCLDL
jgi:hypothetical protein